MFEMLFIESDIRSITCMRIREVLCIYFDYSLI